MGYAFMNPSDADTVEELAEIGVAFLELDIEAERCSVLHGDEQQSRPAIQCFSGFTVHELDLLDWLQWNWEGQLQTPQNLVDAEPEDFRGRYALLVGLHSSQGQYLGLLHADRLIPFSRDHQKALGAFALIYGQHLESLMGASLVMDLRGEEIPPQPLAPADPRELAWMDFC